MSSEHRGAIKKNFIMDVNDLNKSLKQFKTIDQIVFAIMLGICSVIGLYFGYHDLLRKKRSNGENNETLNFLMGGKKLSTFPVAMSLIASLVSGILLLGEYLSGSNFIM